MDFTTLQTEVFRRLEESSSSPRFWSLADVKTAINEGYRDLADTCDFHEASVSFPLQERTYYELRDYIPEEYPLRILRVMNEDTERYLYPLSVRDLDQETYLRWEVNTGEPQHFFLRGPRVLGLHPKWDETSATFATPFLTLWYVAIPQPLTADGDVPAFPVRYHEALILYAVYDLKLQEGENRLALRWWREYILMRDALRSWAQGTTGRAGLDRDRGFREESGFGFVGRTRV